MSCFRKQKERRFSREISKKFVKTSLPLQREAPKGDRGGYENKKCVYECNICGSVVPITINTKKFGSGIWIHNERVHFIDYSPRCLKTEMGENVHIVEYTYKKNK